MTRLEKCELLKSKGYTYDPETGKIFGKYGKEIVRKTSKGYISLNNGLYGHHYAWYCVYGNVDFEMLDHINEEKKGIEARSDNRICNLRISDAQRNQFNRNDKGYYWNKVRNKWHSQIRVKNKRIDLGFFDTEEEVKNAYLQAKKKYHII